ncbi:MAG: PEP-CTERM sorting domain-containing protein [Acidobacteriia bacterium]|nr:PEP-CTERM sorting domain-containing protein [Terriglobia bacterium]
MSPLVIGLALDPGVLLVGGTGLQVNSVTIIPAPEPWTLALLGIGLGSFLVGARLRQRPA